MNIATATFSKNKKHARITKKHKIGFEGYVKNSVIIDLVQNFSY